MKILVLNCGSSSIKFQVFETINESVLASGSISKIGTKQAVIKYEPTGKEKITRVDELYDHQMTIEKVIAILTDREIGVVQDSKEIGAVGHRVVHGGEKFSGSVLITPEVLEQISDCIELAPLHNPHNLRGIEVTMHIMPGTPQVAVFDTAFHQSIPEKAYLYAIPYILYKRHAVRRYGFHGTSHLYVSQRCAELMGKKPSEVKVITAHLGNGCSITAVDKGHSVDTSMGFTPLEGLVMGTRCGDMDPAVVTYLISKEELGLGEVNTLMNKHSGLMGLSGQSNDMGELLSLQAEGNVGAKRAIDVFCYRMKKYIGAYAAAMGGLDAVAFTAGIGENSSEIRAGSCEGLEFMGLEIDPKKNKKASGKEMCISTDKSKVQVWVVPTAEELIIARDTDMLTRSPKKKAAAEKPAAKKKTTKKKTAKKAAKK